MNAMTIIAENMRWEYRVSPHRTSHHHHSGTRFGLHCNAIIFFGGGVGDRAYNNGNFS